MASKCSHIISLIEGEKQKGNIFLSGVVMLKQAQQLKQLGVGAILTILDPWAIAHFKVIQKMEHLSLKHLHIKLQDDEQHSILPHVDSATTFMKDELEKHNVLVHCQAGVSRSPSFVIAFLMTHANMSLSAAKALVKKNRTCVEPNSGFQKDLQAYQKQLQQIKIESQPK